MGAMASGFSSLVVGLCRSRNSLIRVLLDDGDVALHFGERCRNSVCFLRELSAKMARSP